MTLLFPLAEVPATELKSFVEVSMYLIGAVLLIVALVKAFRPSRATEISQPLVVEKRQQFTPVELTAKLQIDLDALREQRRVDVAGLHRKIEEGLQGLRNDLSREFKEVRGEAVGQREAVASLKTETSHQTRQMMVLDSKIDQMPAKILQLLGGSFK